MTQKLVKAVRCMVVKDAMNTIAVDVPAYELPLLRAVRGSENVIEAEGEPGDCIIDPSSETDRLRRKYGEEAVAEAYGAAFEREIATQIEALATGDVEAQSGIVLEGPDSGVNAAQVQAQLGVKPKKAK